MLWKKEVTLGWTVFIVILIHLKGDIQVILICVIITPSSGRSRARETASSHSSFDWMILHVLPCIRTLCKWACLWMAFYEKTHCLVLYRCCYAGIFEVTGKSLGEIPANLTSIALYFLLLVKYFLLLHKKMALDWRFFKKWEGFTWALNAKDPRVNPWHLKPKNEVLGFEKDSNITQNRQHWFRYTNGLIKAASYVLWFLNPC